jgi:hypothetical protein
MLNTGPVTPLREDNTLVITTLVQDIIRQRVSKVHGGGWDVLLRRQYLGIIADMS